MRTSRLWITVSVTLRNVSVYCTASTMAYQGLDSRLPYSCMETLLEENFREFCGLWLFARNLEAWCPLARHKRAFRENRIFHQFFSLESFPLYSIHHHVRKVAWKKWRLHGIATSSEFESNKDCDGMHVWAKHYKFHLTEYCAVTVQCNSSHAPA